MQDALAVLAAPAASDRLVEEEPERPAGDRLARQAALAVATLLTGSKPAPAEQHHPRHLLGQRQPALRVEEEVVLQALA